MKTYEVMNKRTVKEIYNDPETKMKSFSVQTLEEMVKLYENRAVSLKITNNKLSRIRILCEFEHAIAKIHGNDIDIQKTREGIRNKRLYSDSNTSYFSEKMSKALYYAQIYGSLCAKTNQE